MHSIIRQHLQHYLHSYKRAHQEVPYDSVLDTKENSRRRKLETQQEAGKKLEEAKGKPVAFAIRTKIAYDGELDDDSPIIGRAISFQVSQFLHISEKFNDDWWIGRLVIDGSMIGFVPSPSKLESADEHHCRLIIGKLSSQKAKNLDEAVCGVYDIVPVMRPICLVGPSLKGFHVTDMMQKAVFDFLKERFRGRIIMTRVSADISFTRTSQMITESAKETRSEVDRIFELGKSMQLVVVDCDLVNYPTQITDSILAPIIVYIRVSNTKVLQKLIKTRGKSQMRYLKSQLNATERLLKCPESLYDVIIDENRLKEACERLAVYLETYWRATHPGESFKKK